MRIQLLGTPTVQRGGIAVEAPAGRKHWGLLTFLVRTEVPSSRERLSGLLFPEADDPLGALRSALSALRRQLGPHAEVGGNPVRLSLGPAAFVDVEILRKGSWLEAIALPGLGHELLDGMAFRSSPGFENWLENERRHVAGTTAAVLHEAALALLARGEVESATDHASQLVRLNPYEENSHVLLARCLRAAGDPDAAARQVTACTELFNRELGIDPSPALRAAAADPPVPKGPKVSGRAAVRAQVEAGEAAIAAAAIETGLVRLRGAVAAARAAGELDLLARALVTLGGALVHSARGTDEEGAAALHEGSALAEQLGENALAATGWRETGWVQFLRSRYDRAETSLARATDLGRGHDEELAWVDVILGCCRSDVGHYAEAAERLRSAIDRSDRTNSVQAGAYGRAMLGRLYLLRGELDEARHMLDEALEFVQSHGWTAFVPWPESFRAEIDLRVGDVDAAEERLEHAFALGCQVGDPCWESIAARGLGLVAAERGDVPRALELLADAPRLCRRLPDTYLWIEAYGRAALCAVALDHGAEASGLWIGELEKITARRGMRELLVHALVYRARLGESGALVAARALAAEIDNPALDELLASAELSAAA
ncbi:MAG: BTAD domain-containing putative transcriptional regulator [Gaiellaceae bacterium]